MSAAEEEMVWEVDWNLMPAPEAPVVVSPSVSDSAMSPVIGTTVPAAVVAAAEIPPAVLAESLARAPSITPGPAPLPEHNLVRGERRKLTDLGIKTDFEIRVNLEVPASLTVDVTCIGLDERNQLSNEEYFVYFNHAQTPCGGVALLGAQGADRNVIGIALDRIPSSINRLVVVATFDDEGLMRRLGRGMAVVQSPGGPLVKYSFIGSDFGSEKALMLMEVYRKEAVWRLAAPGQGFAGGLAELLKHFGASVV